MTTEIISCMIITFFCTLPLFLFGIVQIKSDRPVVFWAGKEPPKKEQVTDVRAYNKKHGLMWILYGVGFDVCFFVGIFFGGEIAAVLAGAECLGGLLLMILCHNKLEEKYVKK